MMHKKILAMIFISISFFIVGCAKEEHKIEDEHSEAEHSDEVVLTMKSIKEINIISEIAKLQSYSGFITVPAKVIVNQDNEAQVGSLVQGRVFKVLVKVGDYVNAGAVLMYMEGLEIGEIKSDFLKAKANLDFYKANYERQKTLVEQKVGSQKSFLEAQAEYEKASAEYLAEDKKIHSVGLSDEDILDTKNQLNESHTSGTIPVKSPISGIVVERNIVIGQSVDAATNAFKIINTSNVWIDGQLYEKDANRISENSDVFFSSSTYPGEKFIARINYVGKVIDESSRTITVRAELNNPKGKLKPQMFGELHISSGINSKAILVPLESVFKIENNDFVFVAENDSVFQKRAVKLGSPQNEMIEIMSGVKEGERVVIKGSFYLKSEIMKSEIEEHEH